MANNRYSVSDVLGLLQAATLEPAKLPEAISALQALVWKSQEWDSGLPTETVEALADLAYDLDFYERTPPRGLRTHPTLPRIELFRRLLVPSGESMVAERLQTLARLANNRLQRFGARVARPDR